mmetsp:Transcript_18732/g.58429  ORF Transcript_18732/g.58429 Transcript_18732/m.58429 type:complete len:215 (-) Transcript_18732:501-1145(-)
MVPLVQDARRQAAQRLWARRALPRRQGRRSRDRRDAWLLQGAARGLHGQGQALDSIGAIRIDLVLGWGGMGEPRGKRRSNCSWPPAVRRLGPGRVRLSVLAGRHARLERLLREGLPVPQRGQRFATHLSEWEPNSQLLQILDVVHLVQVAAGLRALPACAGGGDAGGEHAELRRERHLRWVLGHRRQVAERQVSDTQLGQVDAVGGGLALGAEG